MTGNLDEISQSIGQLQEGQDERVRTMARIEGVVNDIRNEMKKDRHEVRNEMQIFSGRLSLLEQANDRRSERDKANRVWGAGILSVMGTVGGATADYLFKKFGG